MKLIEAMDQDISIRDSFGIPDITKVFVKRNGVEFPEWEVIPRRMRAKECFSNALHHAMHNDLMYVEGFAWHDTVPMLIHHAWCCCPGDKSTAIETTWNVDKTAEYMGVVFEPHHAWSIMREHGYYGLFDTGTGINTLLMSRMDSHCAALAEQFTVNRRKS